jgi:PilZ domain
MAAVDQSETKRKSSVAAMERRRNLRFPFTATVEAVETKSGTKIVARTSDLSLGGCYIDTLSPFPIGSEVTIRILRNKETFEAQSKVVYSMIGMGMGLAFTSAQPKQVRLFQRWLLEISGQGGPPPETAPEESAENARSENTQSLMKSGVLSELIMTLMKKKVLTEVEGKEMLRKLFT